MKRYLILSYLSALVIFPGTELVFILALILWFGQGAYWDGKPLQIEDAVFWLGYIFFVTGAGTLHPGSRRVSLFFTARFYM